MTDSDTLAPPQTATTPLAGPQTAPADPVQARPDPLPCPASPGTPDGPLTLDTTLLGPLTLPDGADRAAELADLSRRAALYATRARGDGTRRAYRSAWRAYETWCHSLGRQPLAGDADTIAMYVVRLADQGAAGRGGLAVSSIRVALAAIKTAHLLAGRTLDLRHPRLAMVLEGITRSKTLRPRRKATPAVPGLLRQMLAAIPALPHPHDPGAALVARQRAMLLLGFGAALRRSELVDLALGDVERIPGKGLLLTIRRSKTDQHGQGQRVAVCANRDDPGFCPLAALDAWLAHRRAAADLDWTASAAMRAERPLFCAVTKTGQVTGTQLSDKAVVRLVKQAAARAGLDPLPFSGHSLRRGLLTAAGENHAALADLMRQSRHKSAQVVLGYIEPADLWKNNVAERVFQGVMPTEETG